MRPMIERSVVAASCSVAGMYCSTRKMASIGDPDVGVHDGVDADRDVVARDHLLLRDLDDLGARVDHRRAIDPPRQHQHHAGPERLLLGAPEAKHDGALVLAQDA